jgi:probable F420-dependent oxidoreductase
MPVLDLAKAVEDLRFESFFVTEHTHVPVRDAKLPSGAPLPREYSHVFDPFLTLAAVAARTSRLRIGTGICLVIERDPILLAKEVATLDQISDGRFLFGVGGGWNSSEMRDHGTDPALRFKILRERILAMKEIWTHDKAEFHGRFVDFDPMWQWPKPNQRPYPPILVGGNGQHTLERVVEYGDGWIPLAAEYIGGSGPWIQKPMAELSRLSVAAGRASIPVTVFGGPADPDIVRLYFEAGVQRYVFALPSEPASTMITQLTHLAEIAAAFGQ